MTHIAVIDIGKTNAKLALVDGVTLAEIAVVTRPNTPLPGPPWQHFDLAGHWQFFLHHLEQFHKAHGISAISVTTHGASAVLMNASGRVAVPMLDYEHPGPDDFASAYDVLRPDFAQTGSPRLPVGLNLGAQLHWLLETQPELARRIAHIVTYPQYWGWLLTGEMASDVSSLGCHTDLWDPWRGEFSPLVERLGLTGKLAPARRANEILGHLRRDLANQTGLRPDTPVTVGIHDSNASLYPYVLGRKTPFSVVSTGTWVIAMGMGASPDNLDPARDVLVNVNALGQPVPSARFMGGREYEIIRDGSDVLPTDADRAGVLSSGLMLLPSVEPGSGPYKGQKIQWRGHPRNVGEKMVALSWYLALMTDVCLKLIDTRGPSIIEGPFGRNVDYCAMLATLRPEGVEIADSATGTSVGAALLCLTDVAAPKTQRVSPEPGLRDYAARWNGEVG